MLLLTINFNLHARWEIQLDNQNLCHLDRIHFIDQNYGRAIGGATIGCVSPYLYTTNDGEQWYLGDDWMNRQIKYNTSRLNTGIYFIKTNNICLKFIKTN